LKLRTDPHAPKPNSIRRSHGLPHQVASVIIVAVIGIIRVSTAVEPEPATPATSVKAATVEATATMEAAVATAAATMASATG
jgi:hypothetical protein